MQTNDRKSWKWANLFSRPDLAQEMFNHPAWALLAADLKILQDSFWAEFADSPVSTPEQAGITKGLTRGFNFVLDLPRALSDWQEREKSGVAVQQDRGVGGY